MSKKKKTTKKRRRDSNLHPRVMISGYYGFDNLGDELILQVLVDELKARDVKITVLSANPAKTRERYGVDAISRTSIIDIIDALAYTNLFISGGGGLFQDATGPMSPIYYGALIRLARFFEVPVCFWAQGVGPLRGGLARKITSTAVRQCEAVIVRDEASAELVEKISGVRPEVTADPVWLLNTGKPRKNSAKGVEKRPWRVGISLRPWPELDETRLGDLADCLKSLVEGSVRPVEFVMLPFQPKEDTPILRALTTELERRQADGTCIMADPDDMIARVGECDILLGMRFHSLVLGLLQDVPVYGLVYDPKVATLLEMFDLRGTAIRDLGLITPAMLEEAFNRYPAVNLKGIRRQARRNISILNRLLEIPEAELVL